MPVSIIDICEKETWSTCHLGRTLAIISRHGCPESHGCLYWGFFAAICLRPSLLMLRVYLQTYITAGSH